MYRFQIGLIAAGVLLVSTVAIVFGVTSKLESSVTQDAEDQARRSAAVYQQMSRLEGLEFANVASKYASRDSMPKVFDAGDETERRKAAFTQCETIQKMLEAESQRAAIVAVLDKTGKVVARDLNANAMYGEDLSGKEVVKEALAGKRSRDVWTLGGRTTRVAVAPIMGPSGPVGAVLLGYVLSHQEARKLSQMIGAEIGLFHQGKMQTSSFVTSEGKEDGNETQAMTAVLFSGDKLAEQALSKGQPTDVKRIELDGAQYAAVAAPSTGNLGDKTSGFAVLVPLASGAALASSVATSMWLLGIIGILLVAFAAGLTARRFVRPLDQIEVGVAEIINGNIDYMFKPVGPDFEGLSNGLNVMLARLLGRDDPDEDQVEEEEGTKWKAEQMVIEEGEGQPAGVDAQGLAQESEAAYYPRLYNEYITALRNAGVRADGVSVQAFTAKLRLTEGGLKRKWKCRMVRFVMVASGENIVFRAVKIA